MKKLKYKEKLSSFKRPLKFLERPSILGRNYNVMKKLKYKEKALQVLRKAFSSWKSL
jgi:hypothetical protein